MERLNSANMKEAGGGDAADLCSSSSILLVFLLSSNLDECAVLPGLIFIRAPVFFKKHISSPSS